ncbi:MAG: HAMP domain-containing sensor histidine kinase [Cytophagaceae bacterium]
MKINKEELLVVSSWRNFIIRKFIDVKLLISKGYQYDELIRLEILVYSCLLAYVFGVSYIVISLINGISIAVIWNYILFHTISIPVVLILIKKGKGEWAKFTMVVLGTGFMTYKAGSMGRGSGMDIAMLMIVAGAFAFFSLKQMNFIIATIGLTILSLIFLELTDYSYWGQHNSSAYEYLFNLYTTILFIVIFYYVVVRINEFIRKKIITLNNRLKVKNNRLIALNEELDRYVYRVSHDMRSPITSMMSLNKLIQKTDDINTVRELLQMQDDCIQKLDIHIQQIIDISKNLKTDLVITEANFTHELNEILKELKFMSVEANIDIRTNIEQYAPFFTDLQRLRIILSNLISNSLKYYNIDDPNKYVACTIKVNSQRTLIEIEDNGIGISPETKAKLFTMFFRGTSQSKGSGLGLYIVKEMIGKLHGSIRVESERFKYTRFIIELPNLKK